MFSLDFVTLFRGRRFEHIINEIFSITFEDYQNEEYEISLCIYADGVRACWLQPFNKQRTSSNGQRIKHRNANSRIVCGWHRKHLGEIEWA